MYLCGTYIDLFSGGLQYSDTSPYFFKGVSVPCLNIKDKFWIVKPRENNLVLRVYVSKLVVTYAFCALWPKYDKAKS